MDFCLKSSQMSCIPLQGLGLLLPFIAALLLLIVFPDDFLQELIQRAFFFSSFLFLSLFLFSLFLIRDSTFSLILSLFFSSSLCPLPLHPRAVPRWVPRWLQSFIREAVAREIYSITPFLYSLQNHREIRKKWCVL